jgi:hypothetical protein
METDTMRQITIGIRTENAAFGAQDEPEDGTERDETEARAEVARILRHAAKLIEDGSDGAPLHDSNGNAVGSFDIDDD